MKKNLLSFNQFLYLIICLVITLPKLALGSTDNSLAYDIAKKNACLACHSVDKKIIGPAFKDIARKYQYSENAEQFLLQRVRNGGAGVWGVVAMPANKNISDQDAQKLIQWILQQNKTN